MNDDKKSLDVMANEMKHISKDVTEIKDTLRANYAGRPLSSTNSQVDSGDTNTGQEGGGEAHNNLQPSIALNYIIRI